MSKEHSSLEELASHLGLDPGGARSSLLVDDLADRAVEDALTAEPWAVPSDLAAQVAMRPFYDALVAAGSPLEIHRWTEQPSVVLVEFVRGRGSVQLVGAVSQVEGGVLFPGDAPGMALYTTSLGTFLFAVEAGGKVHLDRLDSPADAAGDAAAVGDLLGHEDEVEFDLPGLAEVYTSALLEEVPSGVRMRIDGLARSPAAADRAAALGLVARAWQPASPRATLERVLAGSTATPSELLVGWTRRASPALLDEWRFQAEGEAHDLIVGRGLEGELTREQDRIDFALRRDRLESLRLVLTAAEAADGLDAALEVLDEGWGPPAAAGPALPDPQLRAVLANDPEAWWARLVWPSATGGDEGGD